MRTARRVIVNGKFLTAQATGVHRVAEELIVHTHGFLTQDSDLAARLQMELWVPPKGVERARRLGVPFREVGPLDGIPWEQITLPVLARGATILSLCNVGPIAARNAITMFHDAQVRITPESYSWPFRAWYRLHQPLAGRRHRRILTVSDFSRDQLASYGIAPVERTSVVLNGVDHVLSTAADDAIVSRLGLRPGRFVVGLANTQKHKNIGLLLDVFATSAMADLTLVLFGAAKPAQFEAAGYSVPPNVRFPGRVTDEELRALYGSALCIAFPSTTEGFGLPPLEAMTTGCPAIVAPCGALSQVCGDAALYAAPDSATEWIAAIRRMADDAHFREERSVQSRAHAAGFTWRASAIRLIEELLEA